jgi:hypothetical protein
VSACVQCTAQGQCGSGSWCDVSGQCQPARADGQACATALECQSGHCSNIGVLPGFCYSQFSKPPGSTCVFNDECQSTQCVLGLCS